MKQKKVKGMGYPIISEDWEVKAEFRQIMVWDDLGQTIKEGLKVSYRPKNSTNKTWGRFTVILSGKTFPTASYILDLVDHAAAMRIMLYGSPNPQKQTLRKKAKK